MRCYISIGSNLGDREKNISDAIRKMRDTKGIEVKKLSRIYGTEPVGGPIQPDFLNAVMHIETTLEPRELLLAMQDIENQLGRIRVIKDGPRTIDLDILIYGDKKIDEPDLKIPHPKMNERDFVLEPLKDLLEV